jgi:DNA-binding NarL/FixJ family response regulator
VNRPAVLIADDNPEWCDLIARILQPNYDIAGFVTRGNEVIVQALALQPQVITLDLSMPEASGMQALPALRKAMPDAVIVVVSVTSNRLYVAEACQRGADGYVAKRRTLSDLIPAIQKGALRRRRLQQRRALSLR